MTVANLDLTKGEHMPDPQQLFLGSDLNGQPITLIAQSPLAGRYDKPIDREPAYEVLMVHRVAARQRCTGRIQHWQSGGGAPRQSGGTNDGNGNAPGRQSDRPATGAGFDGVVVGGRRSVRNCVLKKSAQQGAFLSLTV
jgi:hypothetical protein